MSDLSAVKFTLGELKSIEESLKKLIELPLPIKISYSLSKVLNNISKELILLEEQRMNLVRKYGETNQETKEIKVSNENLDLFVKEFNELLQEELELMIKPININSLGDDLKLSPVDMARLEKFFSED